MVYPRVCGGTAGSRVSGGLTAGLSPRVRGNQIQPAARRLHLRSIPACAGEPPSAVGWPPPPGVYPRVCGGTQRIEFYEGEDSGLSPRVRGNRGCATHSRRRPGSIPACAGEPLAGGHCHLVYRVYPRVCGGTRHQVPLVSDYLGLSPRVRGNLWPSRVSSDSPRSIPACAGEPGGWKGGRLRGEVYPRVCGGTRCSLAAGVPAGGLSPRVRGNLGRYTAPRSVSGSIPACAGEPATATAIPCARWVYPRVCGGTAGHQLRLRPFRGLSPRVRGNRQPTLLPVAPRRSIPACAGEPGS